MEALEQLKEKLTVLVKNYAAQQTENQRLNSMVTELTKQNEALKARITTLEKDVVSVNFDRANLSEEDKDNMRLQLDSVIDEIDNILSTLND